MLRSADQCGGSCVHVKALGLNIGKFIGDFKENFSEKMLFTDLWSRNPADAVALTEAKREVPYFGEVFIFSMDCTGCNYHLADVEPAVSPEPAKYTVEGSGEGVTKILSWAHGSTALSTVAGASYSEIRFLTVENSGGGDEYGIAIRTTEGPFSVLHVTARASGATESHYGISLITNEMIDRTLSGEGLLDHGR